jgi:putative NADPH-quinone reductase
MKKILVINGHPNNDSFCSAIVNSYISGVGNNAEVKTIVLADLDFNPNLRLGFQNPVELEPDLKSAQEKIKWADHLVWVHPVWWGSLPALLKGFIDRVFLPGYAFKYRENSVMWDRLLSGRTAHIFTTMDSPVWYYKLFTGKPGINQLKKATLEFCGVKPVKVTCMGMVRKSTEVSREKWLLKIKKSGSQLI